MSCCVSEEMDERMMVFTSEPQDWQELQSFVGQMFTECGFHTEVSKVVDLVRGKKEIDVFAQDTTGEYHLIIVVECKFWSKSVDQDIVHSFRTVVADCGANIGFIVSKSGFQSGCYKAAEKTNVRLVSLRELEREYHAKWKRAMVARHMSIADMLFPYWDPAGAKRPPDGGTIDWETQRLLFSAYEPICGLGPGDVMMQFKRWYPMMLPVVNDDLAEVGQVTISNDREFFDFVEQNKDKALRHYRILYREQLDT